jgi:predicted nucleotidyltransferase
MLEKSSNFAEVRFIDREQVIRDLRQAVAEAKARYPEIVKVFLFGSLVRGNWTADSDADLIIVARRDFDGFAESCRYQIRTDSIPTDSLVYSEAEFERLARDGTSFVAQNLPSALEL